MIKFAATNNQTGMPVLGIGLTRENCDRLLKGEPIVFNSTTMIGLPVVEIFLMAGETNDVMADLMLDAGFIDEDKIVGDPSLADPHIGKGVQ